MNVLPVVKWAGGKRQLIQVLLPMIPRDFKTYYEPFFGGGALYCSLLPQKAVINDSNAQLMEMYRQIKENPEAVCEELSEIQSEYNARPAMGSKDALYYVLRKEYNFRISRNRNDVAALLIFLNKAGFNGLYRVNASGCYNVPSAHREQVKAFDAENIASLSRALRKAKILCTGFD